MKNLPLYFFGICLLVLCSCRDQKGPGKEDASVQDIEHEQIATPDEQALDAEAEKLDAIIEELDSLNSNQTN